jgi:hypothetical protein
VATRTFTLNTEPHIAVVGDVELKFQPEVYGDEFLDAYERLQEANRRLGVDVTNLSGVDPAKLRATVRSLRGFLARLMLPESAPIIARWDVVSKGKVLGTYTDPEEAEEHVARVKGAELRDESMRLPDRVLVQLLEWAVELYGGGNGQRPPTSSTGSSPASRPAGTPGRAVSRSRG